MPATRRNIVDTLETATHILLSAPPSDAGDPFVELDITMSAGLEWLGYLSTTGVYGNHDGGWVYEQTSLTPAGKRGELRVLAETQVQELCKHAGLAPHIFRLAGIYGPGRNPIRTVLDGKARRLDKPDHVFSRIHVDDIAQVLKASIYRPEIEGPFNVCDDLPAEPRFPIEYACELLECEAPPLIAFEDAKLSPMAQSFYADNKRVRNERIKTELGVKLKYPDYKAGLRDLLEIEVNQ